MTTPTDAARCAPGRLCLAPLALLLALFACKPAAAPASPTATATAPAPAGGLAGPVVSIELTGTSRERDARAALITTTGAAYDPATIAGDVRALWRLGGLADIHVDARPAADGVALRYRLTELPRVRKVEIEGGPRLLTAPWKIRTAELKDVPQDPAALERLTVDLRDDLVANAYLDAAVTRRAVPVDDGRVDIVLDIEAGPEVSLAALGLRGNTRLKTAELEAIFRAHGVAVGQPFVGAADHAARIAVLARYHEIGHVNAALVALPETRSPDRRTISIAFDVQEGDAFRLGEVSFTGALIAPVRDYERAVALRPRQTFVRSKIVAGIEKIRSMHRERGASEPTVLTHTSVDPVKKTLDLTFEISGP